MASPLKPVPRRLFEMLEEQQEPFLLDANLLNNGCSKRSFKSKGTLRCWRLRRRSRAGILRCIVTKLAYWKKALKGERSELSCCFSEMRTEANAAGFHRLSSQMSGEIGWKEVEHSPVSVLELDSDEGSSDHYHSMEEENPSTSKLNSPTKSASIQPRQLLLDYLKEMEEKIWDPWEFLGQKMSANIMQEEDFPWEKQRGDVAIFTNLLELDLSETRREWTQFHAERREIGREIGVIIFEEMREECVIDMLAFHCTLET